MTREGTGPEILLIHGGASPRATWGALKHLSTRWTLLLVHRRGYSPSPPGRHDFDLDAADIESLLASRPHVVAHSYGVLGALIAAAAAPERVRSLTLIEPPLFHLVPGDREVARLQYLGNAFLTEGLDADPALLREFLRIAGAPPLPHGPLPPSVAHAVRRARGGRLPSEARPRLEAPSRGRRPLARRLRRPFRGDRAHLRRAGGRAVRRSCARAGRRPFRRSRSRLPSAARAPPGLMLR